MMETLEPVSRQTLLPSKDYRTNRCKGGISSLWGGRSDRLVVQFKWVAGPLKDNLYPVHQGWWHVNTSLAKTLYVFVFTLQDSTPTRDFHNIYIYIYIYFFYVFYFIFKINTSKLLKNIKNTCFFHIKCTFKKHLKTILNTFQTPSKQVKSYGSPSGIHNHTYALAQRSLLA
jgi:hypothetical protein